MPPQPGPRKLTTGSVQVLLARRRGARPTPPPARDTSKTSGPWGGSLGGTTYHVGAPAEARDRDLQATVTGPTRTRDRPGRPCACKPRRIARLLERRRRARVRRDRRLGFAGTVRVPRRPQLGPQVLRSSGRPRAGPAPRVRASASSARPIRTELACWTGP